MKEANSIIAHSPNHPHHHKEKTRIPKTNNAGHPLLKDAKEQPKRVAREIFSEAELKEMHKLADRIEVLEQQLEGEESDSMKKIIEENLGQLKQEYKALRSGQKKKKQE